MCLLCPPWLEIVHGGFGWGIPILFIYPCLNPATVTVAVLGECGNQSSLEIVEMKFMHKTTPFTHQAFLSTCVWETAGLWEHKEMQDQTPIS